MDYKYIALHGNNPTCGRGKRRYKCFVGIFLSIVLLTGIYFLIYTTHSLHRRGQSTNQKLLLISIDAFGYNIRDKASTPSFDYIAENGVSVDHMLNVFPTSTLTNHQSIVTGLYPENHGIVSNKIYDRETKEKFYMSSYAKYPKFWEDGVPIWIQNELQGHKSGVCFWPAYDVFFGGKRAKYLPDKKYTNPFSPRYKKDKSKNMPLDMRVDVVIDWLKKDDVNFAALYVGELDTVQHNTGPNPRDKKELNKLQAMIVEIDRLIGRLIRKLKEENLESNVNIIIVGDHGQTSTNKTTKVIDLQKYVNLTKEAFFDGGGFIYARPGRTQVIYKKLKQAENREGHFKVYLKDDIPDHFHIRKHKRAGDIMYLPDPGWTLWTYNKLNRKLIKAGHHGYSNLVKDMNPAFFAYGPLFRKNYKQYEVNMVDLYSLMCHILKIKPRKNDGNFTRIKSILKEYN